MESRAKTHAFLALWHRDLSRTTWCRRHAAESRSS